MTEFRYMHGAVYIFENLKAQRVKVGVTIMSTTTVEDRLRDANDKWLEKKATCQICGGRRMVNIKGLVPQHVVSGNRCPGGNALPFEKDVTLAESYLENMNNRLCELSGVEKNSTTRIVNNLKKRIEKFRHYNGPVGAWQFKVAFYTECAEQVELLTHKILTDRLDKLAPFGEVFCCTVSEATKAVEKALSQLGLFNSAEKVTKLKHLF